jgi:hypothetical protein
MITEQLGLRFNLSLNLPITEVNANLWWSSNSGTSVGLSTATPIAQFGLNGGLLIRL